MNNPLPVRTMIRALMVDLDGTLAQTAEANLRAYVQALSESGVHISPASLGPRVQGRHWKQFLPVVLQEAGIDANLHTIVDRKAAIYSQMLASVKLNSGLVSLLRASRGHLKTALVTSASRASVLPLLEIHELAALFDTVVTGDDVKIHKPDPEAYVMAARRLGVTPRETIIFEDSDIGVSSANAFGAEVIRVVLEPSLTGDSAQSITESVCR